MPDVPLTWLGHATFRVDTPAGSGLIDPFLNGNPKCPEAERARTRRPHRVTHGHGDHVGDTVDLAESTAPMWSRSRARGLARQAGFDAGRESAPNKGGTVDVDGTKFTLTDA